MVGSNPARVGTPNAGRPGQQIDSGTPGLRILAGGAEITGDVAITGNVVITGNIVYNGALQVIGAALAEFLVGRTAANPAFEVDTLTGAPQSDGLTVVGGAAGNGVTLQARGANATATLVLAAKGSQTVTVRGGGPANQVLNVIEPGGAIGLAFTPATTRMDVIANGSAADIDIRLTPKGNGVVAVPGAASLLTAVNALTDNAAAGAGTLTNAPTAGDPTKWIRINDAGVARFIPTWT